MRPLLPVLVFLLAMIPSRADALTVRDIIELSRAGLGEEVLLALIEVDPSVFPIDAATLKSLKDAGVSQKVIIAMVRSGRTPALPAAEPAPVPDAAAPPVPAPQPQVIVIDHHDSAPVAAAEVPVYVPVYPLSSGYPPRQTRGAGHNPSSSPRFSPTTGLSAPPPPPSTEIFGRNPSSSTRITPTTGLSTPPPLPSTDIFGRKGARDEVR